MRDLRPSNFTFANRTRRISCGLSIYTNNPRGRGSKTTACRAPPLRVVGHGRREGAPSVGRPSCGYIRFLLLRCSNSMFRRISGEIPVKFWWHSDDIRWNSGETPVKFWKSVLNNRKPTKTVTQPPHSTVHRSGDRGVQARRGAREIYFSAY